MSIRIRVVDGVLVALCAARSMPKEGDIYLDDAAHGALSDKFAEDFGTEGHDTRSLYPEQAAARAKEESNNPNRVWWDSVYASKE